MGDGTTRSVKIRNGFVLAGTILAVFTPIWFAAAALGTKFGLWDWSVGLLKMTGGIGVPLIGVLILVTFITSLLVIFVKPRAGFAGLAGMWLVTLAAATFTVVTINGARAVPPIHDISTNTRAPLTFSPRVMAERGPKSNKIIPPNEATVPFNRERLSDWSGRSLVEIQADAYPNIQTLMIEGKPTADIYAKALATAKAQGLKITAQDANALRIEATAETFWYGFKDDVVIVITPNANGGAVDMRSVSRVGISDMGANAKRIDAFLAAMKA